MIEEKIKRFIELHRRILYEVGLKESLLLNINIFRSPIAARVFLFLLLNGEATVSEAADKLKLELYHKHIYHIFQRLRELGIITRVGYVKRTGITRRGRQASLWRLIA